MSKDFVSKNFRDMRVSVDMTFGVSTINVKFAIDGSHTGIAKVQEALGNIMSQNPKASDALVALAMSLEGVRKND